MAVIASDRAASPPGTRSILWWGLGLLSLFGIIPGVLALIGGTYLTQVATTALVYVILTASLNLVTGTAGLLSLGHAAFYGIGAYTAAILSTRLDLPFLITLPAAGVVAAFCGFLVALPTMRLVSIYFAVATLGIGEMIHVTLLNWVGFTRGPMGIGGIPPITLFGMEVTSLMGMYFAVAVVAAISLWCLHRFTHGYYGNALRSLREDDQCADCMGLNVVGLKVQAFTLSCFFAGVAGALLAHTSEFISPDSFKFMESILILAMAVVGGLGSLPGAVIGAVLLIVLPEALRPIGDFRMVAVGSAMFLCILLLPKGLFGEVSAISLARRQLGRAWDRAPLRTGGNDLNGQGVGWKG
jgi:branched-chain amino acid transport system permease protein